jgi:hypothetical protein
LSAWEKKNFRRNWGKKGRGTDSNLILYQVLPVKGCYPNEKKTEVKKNRGEKRNKKAEFPE